MKTIFNRAAQAAVILSVFVLAGCLDPELNPPTSGVYYDEIHHELMYGRSR